MVYFKILGLAFLASLASCEPPVQGYNYRQPSQNRYNTGNSYIPPSTGFSSPSNSYLPPDSFNGPTGHNQFGSGQTGHNQFGSGQTGHGQIGSGHGSSSYDQGYGQSNTGHDSYDHGHGHDSEVPKSYEFGYSVKDAQSGNDYGRRETSDGNVVRGEYRVALPDGRMQIVTYHADWQTGFHADVRYEGEARYPEPAQNNNQGGYNYNTPSPSGFSGSLTGFHGNGNAAHKPSTSYGPPGYH